MGARLGIGWVVVRDEGLPWGYWVLRQAPVVLRGAIQILVHGSRGDPRASASDSKQATPTSPGHIYKIDQIVIVSQDEIDRLIVIAILAEMSVCMSAWTRLNA